MLTAKLSVNYLSRLPEGAPGSPMDCPRYRMWGPTVCGCLALLTFSGSIHLSATSGVVEQESCLANVYASNKQWMVD